MYKEKNFGSAGAVGSEKHVAFGMLVFGVCTLVLGIWAYPDVAAGPTLDGRYAWLGRWLYDSFGPRGDAGAMILSGTVIAVIGFYRWLRARSKR